MKLNLSQPPPEKVATSENQQETGFADNWSAALGLAISEDLPVTSRMVSTTTESRRKKQISDYTESGEIPYSVAMFYGEDTNGLAGYARDTLGLEGFVTDEEYEEKRAGEYKVLRDYSQGIASKRSWPGVAGQMAGIMHAMALDPIYATSFLTGYGGASTMGQAFLRVGVIEAGIEFVAQGPKMSFKEDIQSEHSGAQAITEIAFAGLGAGALAGLVKGLEIKAFGPKDLTVGQATEVIERIAKSNPEMEPVLNTLRHAGPEENLSKVLQADEAIDIRRATEGPLKTDEKSASEMKAAEYEKVEEDIYLKRNPPKVEDEGVPRGTPKEPGVGGGDTPQKGIVVANRTPDGKIYYGKPGDLHFNLSEDYGDLIRKSGDLKPGDETWADVGFAGPDGKFMTREEALSTVQKGAKDFKSTTPGELDAIDLREQVAKAESKPDVKPEPDLRHPMVKEADALVEQKEATIKIMEDCF